MTSNNQPVGPKSSFAAVDAAGGVAGGTRTIRVEPPADVGLGAASSTVAGLTASAAPTVAPLPPDVLTVAEAAALLRVNVKTVYAEIAAHRIRVVRLGRAVRIPRAVITALLTGK